MANRIQNADNVARVYLVKVKGHPSREMLSRLERGGLVGDKYFKPQSVRVFEEYTQKARVQIVAVNNASVDLKAFCESKGFLVEKITRQAIGHITLHGLEPGHYRLLQKSQLEALYQQPELAERQLARQAEKLEKKAERSANWEERAEGERVRERQVRKVRREAAGERPGIIVKKRPKFEDVYGEPGRSDDRPAPRAPRQGSGWLDQGDSPRTARPGAGFKVRFGKKSAPRTPGARTQGEGYFDRPKKKPLSRGPRAAGKDARPGARSERPAGTGRAKPAARGGKRIRDFSKSPSARTPRSPRGKKPSTRTRS
jgi:hypothetical protein